MTSSEDGLFWVDTMLTVAYADESSNHYGDTNVNVTMLPMTTEEFFAYVDKEYAYQAYCKLLEHGTAMDMYKNPLE